MSEAAGRDVGTTAAAKEYMKQVLPEAPEPLDDAPTGPLPIASGPPDEVPEPLSEAAVADREPA